MEKFRENDEKIARNFLKIFLKIKKKKKIFSDFLINFRITNGKYCINFKQTSRDFRNQLVGVLRNCYKILEKLRENFEEIL